MDLIDDLLLIMGLQNQSTGDELVGGFDSHALPPLIVSTTYTSSLDSLRFSFFALVGDLVGDFPQAC